jgi:ligand-binding sensor domain-containing protein/signal transduction histidine kinase
MLLLHGMAFGTPEGYTKRLYQMRDGLPEQTVQAFAQTPDRYLWIGTTGGLLRFDGARFVLFNHDNTPALRENSVFCLLTARNGELWIGTEGGGLVRLSHGVFRLFSVAEGLTDGFVRTIAEDRQGTIWVGTDNGLFRYSGGAMERVDGRKGVPQIAVHAIRPDSRGRLWVGGSKLLAFENGVAREYRLPGLYSQNRVKSIQELRDGSIWVGTVSGLNRMDRAGNFHRVASISGTVRTLCEASDGALWAGTIGHGITVYREGKTIPLTAPESLPSNTVLNVFEDAEKNVWIGTQAGLLRYSRTPVSVLPLPGAADSDFGTLTLERDGMLWVASTHLFRLQGGKAIAYVLPGMAGEHVRNVFRDRDGSLWLGTDGSGVFHSVNGRLEHYTSRQGLVNNFVRVFLQGRDGSLWIGTDEGVSHWNGHEFHNYQVRDGLCHFSIRSLLQDAQGGVWIGTDHGLSHLREGVFVQDAATETLRQEKVWAIHADSDGHLWFGTRNNGLYRFAGGSVTHYTTADGLASNSVYQILEDGRGNFWLSSPGGISLLNRHELDQRAARAGQGLSLVFYGFSDQAEATEIYGGTQPSGWMGAQGDVWFPSNRGPIHILPRRTGEREAPPVVIEQLAIDGRLQGVAGTLRLSPDNSRLEISYAPVLLGSQEGLRCRYKLEGFDENWSEASSRRIASYTNLPPGHYRFRVQVFDVSMPGNVSEDSLTIVKRPHFYRTYWFIGVCLLGAASLVLAFYRLRLRQMRARFRIVLEERSRLAREMHDTVIQGCTGVSALLEALSSLEKSSPEKKDGDLLEFARRQMRATIEEARQAVWNLRRGDAASDDFNHLATRMAEKTTAEAGIPTECRISGKVFALNQLVSHELSMVIRESLHNAVRHAHPSRIDVAIDYGTENLAVRVTDDGAGFAPSTAAEPVPGHYGIMGMRERVRRIGGRFALTTAPGTGTEILIEVPRGDSVVLDDELGVG